MALRLRKSDLTMPKPITRILVATDFTNSAVEAAQFAAQLARQLHATVELATVVDTSGATDRISDPAYRTFRVGRIHEEARGQLRRFAEEHLSDLRELHVHVLDAEDDKTFPEIIRAAQALGCDLIVVGTHGRRGLEHFVLGSVAEQVIRRSPIPVLSVRKST